MQLIKIISHYIKKIKNKKIGYNINVLQQTACLVVNPITVGNFAFLFNCTPVGRTSDSLTVSIDEMVGPDSLAVVRPTGFTCWILFCSGIQFYLLLSPYLCFSPFYILTYMF